MAYYVAFGIIVLLLLAIGFHLGKYYVGFKCLTEGHFQHKCQDIKVLCGCDKENNKKKELKDNGAFSQGTLDKLKFLSPKLKHKLTYELDNPDYKYSNHQTHGTVITLESLVYTKFDIKYTIYYAI